MIDLTKPVELAPNLWWVGSSDNQKTLHCNPYLLLQGGSYLLFDPGSVLDAEIVLNKVRSIIPIQDLEAIILSHQDPDLCSSLPLFEQAGFTGKLCCHERASMIIQYYGLKSAYYLVNQNNYQYRCKDGSSIGFLFAPYLHFPGAIMSYLPQQKTLISGDLFGSISANWELFAGPEYKEGMIAFHEVYMPSHEILRPVMEQLQYYQIDMICPQHGSVLKESIQEHILTLKNMQCGLFLTTLRKQVKDVGGMLKLCNKILRRYFALYGNEFVHQVFDSSPFTVSYKEKVFIKASLPEEDIWNELFSLIEERKGVAWLTAIASLVELLTKEYDLILPPSYKTLAFHAQKNLDEQRSKAETLQYKNEKLEAILRERNMRLFIDPVTQLNNQEYYEGFILEEMKRIVQESGNLAFLLLSIDNLANLNLDFGSAEGDKTMLTLANLIRLHVSLETKICRLAGGIFAINYPSISKEAAIEEANSLQNKIAEEESFIIPISVSMGLYHSVELPSTVWGDTEQMAQILQQSALFRLKLAQKQGNGILMHTSTSTSGSRSAVTVLLIDKPSLARDLIKQALERERYRVLTVSNGLEAKELIAKDLPDIIICEQMIEKIGSFTLRKELLKTSNTQRIPFILISANKNERTVLRALSLGISYFFIRPGALDELSGVVNILASQLKRKEM